ncbi:MAG: hypothetical protein AB7L76_07840 [Burkholderiaceae bacterium]
MNRHQLSELGRAYARYQTHLDHHARLLAAINEGRLQPRPSGLFPVRSAAAVHQLSVNRPARGAATPRTSGGRTARQGARRAA